MNDSGVPSERLRSRRETTPEWLANYSGVVALAMESK